ncbi:D-alanyl-D-alanine carboxypeptidase family protein [Marinicella sp. S1101]|uniref:M15 family metallopeptidase n=1 Tax=Marinicella marina TaxID=2996016 RepID=UPI0022609B39|nr:M15 family metallopeptidase [Marinicella marina]MCX7553631.1 D-alanyl-D-alanine carboxypeptidase family protein [Marinicella marina]MDJ1140255.1 D-alanyl-D-alanine carboxypeptidase family protein [Marinicella marina]
MINIQTDRLNIKPTHKNCWSIFDQQDDTLIGKLFFRNHWFNIILKPQSLRLGVATEASYGLMKAINSEKYMAKSSIPHAQQFLKELGFEPKNKHFEVTIEQLQQPDLYQSLNHKLGIDTEQLNNPKYHTTAQLVDSDVDCFQRPTKLHPKANQAWQSMKQSANKDGVNLQLVSAFRSMGYQAGIIQMKIDQGQILQEILQTNAAPGHSQHHTGCAIDITSDDFEPLSESFENSPAFDWLQNHAADHGFTMSYPRDNDQGIIYEPWHWCYAIR